MLAATLVRWLPMFVVLVLVSVGAAGYALRGVYNGVAYFIRGNTGLQRHLNGEKAVADGPAPRELFVQADGPVVVHTSAAVHIPRSVGTTAQCCEHRTTYHISKRSYRGRFP